MAKYKYLITDKYGKEKKGTMEAVSEEAAMRKLKGEGSIVLELSEAPVGILRLEIRSRKRILPFSVNSFTVF
mgnify:CR=1 FL=1